MGRLRALQSEEELELPSRALIGRSPACDVPLSHRLSSKEHARIHWTGDAWILRDLGSTNGTFADGARLDPGTEVALHLGSKVAFGDSKEQVYELVSDAPPVARAKTTDGRQTVFARHGILTLPSEEDVQLTVFESAAGRWFVEEATGEVREARSSETLEAGGQSWSLDLPAPDDRTPIADQALSLAITTLLIRVTRDQEEVEIGIATATETRNLGPRWYGYFLLVLARALEEDLDKAPSDRGWRKMTDLSKMLRLDSNALNVATHRARRELGELGLKDAVQVIESRRGYRRLGTSRVRIEGIDR